MKMPTLNRKVRIFLDWVLAFLFPPDLVEVRTSLQNAIHKQHFEAGDVVFYQGDVSNSVYIIEAWRVRCPAREERGSNTRCDQRS